MTSEFTHLDNTGRAHMVDVGAKPVTKRRAVAEAVITMSPEVKKSLFGGSLPKGDALGRYSRRSDHGRQTDSRPHPPVPSDRP